MPLLSHESIVPIGELGLWKITETEDFFLEKLTLFEEEKENLSRIKGQGRSMEWLASRYLLHYMSGRAVRGALIKDEHGKPVLENSSYHISLSHSHGVAAAIATPFSVGIDVQKMVAKIERIAHKFMRDEEMESLKDEAKLEHLHVYWGAKEALYKAYGRRELDFRKHILINPFDYDLKNGFCSGQVIKDDFSARYQIWYERRGEFILVWGIQE